MKEWPDFRVGDIVSRLGDDMQEIIGRNDVGDLIEVRCIKPDAGGVFLVGDTEWNIPWRYEFIAASNVALHRQP